MIWGDMASLYHPADKQLRDGVWRGGTLPLSGSQPSEQAGGNENRHGKGNKL